MSYFHMLGLIAMAAIIAGYSFVSGKPMLDESDYNHHAITYGNLGTYHVDR